jgi:hypothetical protein
MNGYDRAIFIVINGVMSTPGFVIDDKVKSVGKVLKVAQIKKLLSESK